MTNNSYKNAGESYARNLVKPGAKQKLNVFLQYSELGNIKYSSINKGNGIHLYEKLGLFSLRVMQKYPHYRTSKSNLDKVRMRF